MFYTVFIYIYCFVFIHKTIYNKYGAGKKIFVYFLTVVVVYPCY